MDIDFNNEFDDDLIPAMGTETLAANNLKKLISPERNNLGDDIIEALECLKARWGRGFVERD